MQLQKALITGVGGKWEQGINWTKGEFTSKQFVYIIKMNILNKVLKQND